MPPPYSAWHPAAVSTSIIGAESSREKKVEIVLDMWYFAWYTLCMNRSTKPLAENAEWCFACGKQITGKVRLADTREDKENFPNGYKVFVGPWCYQQVQKAGNNGYKPPGIGPRLYPMPQLDSCPSQSS